MSIPLGMVWYFMPEDAFCIGDLLKKPLCQNHFNLKQPTLHFISWTKPFCGIRALKNAPKPRFLRENPTLPALASLYICIPNYCISTFPPAALCDCIWRRCALAGAGGWADLCRFALCQCLAVARALRAALGGRRSGWPGRFAC